MGGASTFVLRGSDIEDRLLLIALTYTTVVCAIFAVRASLVALYLESSKVLCVSYYDSRKASHLGRNSLREARKAMRE